MEFLKEHLGEVLFGQVAEKLKDKGIKLADLSSGNYVLKEKYVRAVTDKDEQVKAKEAELAELRKNLTGDEQLKKQVSVLTDELNGAKTELGRYRNEKVVLQAGIKGKYVNATIAEATKLVGRQSPEQSSELSSTGNGITFEKAVEMVTKDYPEWKDEVKARPSSSFPLSGTQWNVRNDEEESIKTAANNVFRKAAK